MSSSYNHTITIDGNTVHYEVYEKQENRPNIILIHGFLSSTFSFRRLIPLLTEHFNVIAVDLPPFGKSGKEKKFLYTFQNLAKVVVELLHNLGINRAILVGHSMGGQIALYMAKYWPDLVDRIVLLSSSGYSKRLKNSIIFATYLPFFNRYVKYWLARKGVMQNLLNVVSDHSLIDDEMIDGYGKPFDNEKYFVGLTKFARDREGDLPAEDLKMIQVPCLLIWGEEDRVVPISIGKRLNKDLPNSSFVSLPNTGHLIPEEEPVIIFDHIKKFTNV
jgi:pimeloyl-ACP methyl ester carboxylesterase